VASTLVASSFSQQPGILSIKKVRGESLPLGCFFIVLVSDKSPLDNQVIKMHSKSDFKSLLAIFDKFL
jgi:hypothetical protein